jgi:hypothetical protein
MKTNSILAAAAALAIAAPASAANLVSNGGFEINGGSFSDSFADWNLSDNFAFFPSTGIGAVVPYEGDWFASTGCAPDYCSISQTIATQPGQSYTLSFAFNPGANVETGGASTLVFFGGDQIGPDIGVGPLGWTVYSYTVTGSGLDTLTFSSIQSPAFNGIDSVSLVGVPEPASWAMLISGFGLVGAAARRRRQGTVAA